MIRRLVQAFRISRRPAAPFIRVGRSRGETGRKFSLAIFAAFALIGSIASSFAQVPGPVPALPDVERRTSYSISASPCACAVNFALYGDSNDYWDWVEVFLNGVRVNFNDPTFGWTITSPTGPLATIPRPITDAVLTFASAQTGTVQIVGARRPRRVSQFSENTGVSARNLNQALTDIVAQNRETWDKTNDVTGRAVLAPPGETLALLPAAAARANSGACFDTNGNLINCISIPSGAIIAGTGIRLTGTNPTSINTNLSAGAGIAISGTNPQQVATNLAAGNGVTLTGTNPISISAVTLPQAVLATSVGFKCDGVTDDTPAWNAFMNAVDAGTYAKGTKVYFPLATCIFNSRPRMMASNISLLGSTLQNTVFIRNYQPGLALTITNVTNNGGGTCRVAYTPAGNLPAGSIGIFGVVGATVANNSWLYNQIDTTHVDLSGCAFGAAYTSGGTLLTRPGDPFIELGPQSAADCVGFVPTINPDKCGVSQEINNFTILSAANTYGGIGFDMGSFNFGGGYGYVYNAKADHLFISISGASGWWIAHGNNGCSSPGSPPGSFEGNRDNTVSNSSFYPGVSGLVTVFLQCTLASRYLGTSILEAGPPPILGDLVIGGSALIPNNDLIMSGTTANNIVYEPFATISNLSFGNVANVTFSAASAVDNLVTAGNCSGVVNMIGVNNVVICNSNIFASSSYVIQSGGGGGVQLANSATSWAAVSDERLKQNIKPLSVLDHLNDNVAYSFDWKDGGKHEPVGVIAQRVGKMFPGVVTHLKGKDGGDELGVYKDQVGILALQGVKELKDRMDRRRPAARRRHH